jgi:hypothetical protein
LLLPKKEATAMQNAPSLSSTTEMFEQSYPYDKPLPTTCLFDSLSHLVFQPYQWLQYYAHHPSTGVNFTVPLVALLATFAPVGWVLSLADGQSNLYEYVTSALGYVILGGFWLVLLSSAVSLLFYTTQSAASEATVYHQRRHSWGKLFSTLALAQAPWLFWAILEPLQHHHPEALTAPLGALLGLSKLLIALWWVSLQYQAIRATYQLSTKQGWLLTLLPTAFCVFSCLFLPSLITFIVLLFS